MTFDKRSLQTVLSALAAAAQWEDDLAAAYSHLKTDPAYGKALRTAAKYRKLRLRILSSIQKDGKNTMKKKQWAVDCLDTFSNEWYGHHEFETEGEAEGYAEKRRAEIKKSQPDAGSIQDRVYVTDPNNVQR